MPVLEMAVLSARLAFELPQARVEVELLRISIEVPKIDHLKKISIMTYNK